MIRLARTSLYGLSVFNNLFNNMLVGTLIVVELACVAMLAAILP
jgi:hypothetical protein